MQRISIHRSPAALAALVLMLACRLAPAADVKEVKLDAAQQEAATKLRAKGAAVMQIAADTDALAVNLGIVGKGATDEDLALVKRLPKVQQLDLHNTAVTDAGLKDLAGMTALTQLHLNGTAVTDAGLEPLKDLAALEYLNLYGTAVTDAGLKNLEGLKKLKRVYLWQTKVTEGGAKSLKGALPEVYVNRGEELTLPPPATKPADEKKPDDKKPAVAAADKKPATEQKPAAETAAAGKPVNEKCPVSGKELAGDNTVLFKGKTVGFCCEKCPVAWAKEPNKYAAKIPALAVLLAEDKPAAVEPKPAADKPAADKKGDDKQAAGIDAEGFIRTWLVIGPIPIEGSGGEEIDKAQLPNEGDLKPKDGGKAKAKDKELAWRKVTSTDAVIDFNEILKAEGEMNVAAYAVAYVDSPEEMKDVTLLMGSNDQGKVYLNGKELAKFTEGRSLEKDTEKAEGLTLKKGTNVVVLKVINEGNNWQGCVRLAGKDGKPVKGLAVKAAAE